jgi:hypothetical protein
MFKEVWFFCSNSHAYKPRYYIFSTTCQLGSSDIRKIFFFMGMHKTTMGPWLTEHFQ